MNLDLMVITDAWKDTIDYKKKVKATIRDVKRSIKKPRNTSISYSGGKDSLVMVHLITTIFPEINIWHWDYGIFMPRKFEIQVLKNLKSIAPEVNLMIDKRISKEKSSKIGYKAFYTAIKNNIKNLDLEMNVVGLRKEESTARSARLSKGKFEQYVKTTTYFPLSDWRWQDVWAYIYEHDIPYPSIYDLYGPLYGWNKVRFVTFFDPEFNFLGNDNIDKFFLYEEKGN